MSMVLEPDECDCDCHDKSVSQPAIHIAACCDGLCETCGKYIMRGRMDEHVRTKHPS